MNKHNIIRIMSGLLLVLLVVMVIKLRPPQIVDTDETVIKAPQETVVISHSWLWNPALSSEDWQLYKNPRDIEAGPFDDLFIADTGNSRVVRLWEDGNHEIIGRQGEGPGEFMSPSDIYVSHKEKILWVVDGRLGRVTLFDILEKGTSFITTYRSPYIMLNMNSYLIPSPTDSSYYCLAQGRTFRILQIDNKGLPIREFGNNLEEEDTLSTRKNNGYLCKTQSGHLIFVGQMVPIIEKYSSDGLLLNAKSYRELELLNRMAEYEKRFGVKGRTSGVYISPISQAYVPNGSNNIYIMTDARSIDIVSASSLDIVKSLKIIRNGKDIIMMRFCVVETDMDKNMICIYGIDWETHVIVKFEPKQDG